MIVGLRGPARATARVDAFERTVESSARLLEGARQASSAGSDADRLREVLEIAHVQHEELLSAEQELREQVDELSRALATVQIERERYRELFEAAPEACIVTDDYGIIRDANARACELLEISPRHIRGKPLPLYVGPPSESKALRMRIADRGWKNVLELGVDLVGRRQAPVRAELRAVRIEAGKKILWHVRTADDRSAVAPGDVGRQLADARDLLGRERTRRDVLEREARAKDRFLSALSKDLRAPLNAVLGWADLLRRELLDHGRRDRALATIEQNARAVLAVTDELLDISRVERMQLEVRPVDLDGLVRNAVAAASPPARERGVALECTTGAGAVVLGDAKRLNRAVSVLISNAVARTPAAGVVRVTVERVAGHGALAVHDEGAAIPAEDLPHLFECYPLDGEPAMTRPSLGTELFVVRQIALLHGGAVDADSHGLDRGATFRLEIPLADEGPLPAIAPSATRIALDLAGLRVLVVEDDDDARELMGALLSEAGAQIALAAHAREAVEMLIAWRPDAVVTDLTLREAGDGLAIARAARETFGDEIVAIAVSGFSSERDAARSIEAGFDAHVAKPFSPRELVAAIVHAASLRGL